VADDIRQTLELNARQVLDELERLKTGFTSYNDRLSTTANRLDSVTDSAKRTLATLRGLRTEARLVERAMGSVGMGTKSGGLFSDATSKRTSGGVLLGGADASKAFDQFFTNCTKAQQVSAKTGQSVSAAFDKIHSETMAKFVPASKQVKSGTESMFLSWQTFARVIQTQLFVRGMNAVRDAYVESAQAALEFSSNVSSIRAINPERSFGEIAASVRVMSDSFNQSLETVSKAQLEVISDQFSDTADMVNILTAANKLAKSTGEDLVPTAQLLTGALNAYGESAGMAEVRASQFFKTIDLGRLKAGELATALGRVQSIGNSTGVEMEELDAALAAITIGGVKANEASTQLRGILVGLLKPTEEMKKALAKLGFDSGEVAVKTLGLQGTLQSLIGTTDGSTTSVAALFQNQRALAGALRLVGEGAEAYANSLKEINSQDQKLLDSKLAERTQTDAERLTKATNQLKNFWTAEFGADVVEKLNTVIQLVGGGGGLVGAFRNLTGTLPAFTGIVTGMVTASSLLGKTASNHLRIFNANLDETTMKVGGLRTAIGAAILLESGWMLGSKIGEIVNSYTLGPIQAAREAMQANLAEMDRQSAARVRIRQRETDEMIRLARQQFAEENVTYLRETKNYEAAVKAQEQAAKSAFDRIMQHRERMQSKLKSMSEDAAAKATETTPVQTADIEQGKAARKFQRDIEKYSPEDKYRLLYAKTDRELAIAERAAATAKDTLQEQQAAKAWERVESYRQQTAEAAKLLGTEHAIEESARVKDRIDQRHIDALRQQGKLQQGLATTLEQRSIRAEKHTAELDSLRAVIESQLETTVKTAKGGYRTKTESELKRDIGQAEANIGRFQTLYQQYAKEDFMAPYRGDTRAFASLRRDAARALATQDLKTIAVAPSAVAKLQADLQKSFDQMILRVPAMAVLIGYTGLDPNEVGVDKVMDKATERLQEFDAGKEKYVVGTEKMKMANEGFYKSIGKAWETLPKGVPLHGVDTLLMKLGRARQDADLTAEEIKNLRALSDNTDISDVFNWGHGYLGSGGLRDKGVFVENVKTALAGLEEQSKAQQMLKEAGPMTPEHIKEANQVREVLQTLEKRRQAQININENVQWEVDAQGSVKGTLADQNTLLKERIQLLQRSQTKGMAFGGWFANGGSPRGFDTIPAMLSPGEFVVNAASSRKFASQLVAMNAGIQPAYRAEGGSTTNIGDIHVNVNGGGTSRQTAREIATELRREIRRGTVRL